jgi:hypothetical protein
LTYEERLKSRVYFIPSLRFLLFFVNRFGYGSVYARDISLWIGDVMRALSKAALLAVGLSISGTAIADQNIGGPPPYKSQYAYSAAQYPAYGDYYGGYPYYPAYSGYGYPAYGWYSATPYAWPYSDRHPSAPYSRLNPNWVPYAGWR